MFDSLSDFFLNMVLRVFVLQCPMPGRSENIFKNLYFLSLFIINSERGACKNRNETDKENHSNISHSLINVEEIKQLIVNLFDLFILLIAILSI